MLWRKAKAIKKRHQPCRGYSAEFHAKQNRLQVAILEGKPVIKAGVAIPNNKVFAWTNLGNYEVGAEVYSQGLEHPAHVLDLTGAVKRSEEYPPEVYGNEASQ